MKRITIVLLSVLALIGMSCDTGSVADENESSTSQQISAVIEQNGLNSKTNSKTVEETVSTVIELAQDPITWLENSTFTAKSVIESYFSTRKAVGAVLDSEGPNFGKPLVCPLLIESGILASDAEFGWCIIRTVKNVDNFDIYWTYETMSTSERFTVVKYNTVDETFAEGTALAKYKTILRASDNQMVDFIVIDTASFEEVVEEPVIDDNGNCGCHHHKHKHDNNCDCNNQHKDKHDNNGNGNNKYKDKNGNNGNGKNDGDGNNKYKDKNDNGNGNNGKN